MIKGLVSKQFIAFVITGGLAALVNFLSRFIYNQWVSFSSAIILAYITGMITAFVLAKLFVFKQSSQSLHRSAFYFIVVNLVAIVQTWAVSMLLALYLLPWLDIHKYTEAIAHAVGVAVPVFSSYLGHKHFSFK